MRRWARSMNTMKVTTATDITRKKMMKKVESAPVRPSSRVDASACGRLATMPDMMISEMPLPMPRAVICSPSHIRKTVPPTRVTTVTRRKNSPGSSTADLGAGMHALDPDRDAVGLDHAPAGPCRSGYIG